MKMKKYIAFIFLLTAGFLLAQQNLVPNGGFEKYSQGKPQNWRFSQYLNYDRSSDAKSGKYSAKFWANGGSINLFVDDYRFNAIPVEENSEYKFSFWYKGKIVLKNKNIPMKNIATIITWFRDNTEIKKEFLDDEKVITTKQWQQKEITLKVPPGANKMGISFSIEEADSYGFIDDVSLIFSKKIAASLPKPSNFVATSYQREIELSWDKEADSSIGWEVVIDNKQPIKTNSNSFIIEDLQLEKKYSVKVRATKGSDKSEFTQELNVTTKNLNRSKESSERVPHLRTLGNDAQIPKSIRLYYNDLSNPNATIKYFVDGTEIFPQNKIFTFPKEGKQKLSISIDEGDSYQWDLEYNINVR